MGLRNSVWFTWLRKIPVYYVCLVLVEAPKISTKKAPSCSRNSMKLFDYILLLILFSNTGKRSGGIPLFTSKAILL